MVQGLSGYVHILRGGRPVSNLLKMLGVFLLGVVVSAGATTTTPKKHSTGTVHSTTKTKAKTSSSHTAKSTHVAATSTHVAATSKVVTHGRGRGAKAKLAVRRTRYQE